MNQITTPIPKKRIEYIDALRGFTMILVVFHHVLLFSLDIHDAFIDRVIKSFFMPLFFFISGLMGYKENIVWDCKTWCAMTANKVQSILIPTLILGFIYTYGYRDLNISSFVTDYWKLGFWFTFTLFEMFLILYMVNVLVYKPNSGVFKMYQQIAIVTLSVVFLIAILACRAFFPCIGIWCDTLGFSQTFWYFIYFGFGYICAMNKEIFLRVLDNRYFALVIIILYVFAFYANRVYIYPNIDTSIICRMGHHLMPVLIGGLGLIIVYNVFRVHQDSFTSDKKVGKALQYIGKRTLDIYLLHYFFLPYIPQLGRSLSDDRNAVLQLAIGGGISLLVIGVCLVVSNILRTSPILAKFLFGVKK